MLYTKAPHPASAHFGQPRLTPHRHRFLTRPPGKMRMAKSDEAEWWRPIADGIDGLPMERRAVARLGLARAIVDRGDKPAASVQALQAFRCAEATGDTDTGRDARLLLSGLVPRYHAQVATDPVRIAAWDKALGSVIRPGMHALEIGAGCGILSMLAARAGASVTACERDPALAAIARETIEKNGLADAIRILAKPAEALTIPDDLATPADLLLLDIFADNLFAFRPFETLRAARHLLATDAIVVPMRVSLVAALAHFDGWRRMVPGQVAGFDLQPLRAAAPPDVGVATDHKGLHLLSDDTPMIAASLPDDLPEAEGNTRHSLVSHGGIVNGVALWLRLDLAPGITLEARPGTHAPGYYARARFHSFAREIETLPGDSIPISFHWQDKRVSVAPAA